MKKRNLEIINFLHLNNQYYNQILKYRNQEYVREVSLNTNPISQAEHQNYRRLLKEKKQYFAYLIKNDDKDYGVITLKKGQDDIYTIGDYLIDQTYKYEGGGIVNRFCIMFLCNKLSIRYLKSEFKVSNTRGHRAGSISKINSCIRKDNFFQEYAEVLNFYDESVLNSKARKLFDKVYEIKSIKL